MKGLSIIVLVGMAVLIAAAVIADARAEGTLALLSQPLIREGTLAGRLADVFMLGPVSGETEAESALSAAGIAPRNGWIADYPVTPDIASELEVSISDAAETGTLSVTKYDALKRFRDVMAEYNLPVASEDTGQGEEAPPADYPDAEAVNNYYESEGPPVVTYYAPPSDYAYMYDWVASPFWSSGVWFSGFFILTDFDVRVHRHGHKRGDGKDELISNHFRNAGSGLTVRIAPAARTVGRTPSVAGTKASPTLRTHTGSACSTCHIATPSAGSRSYGFPGSGGRVSSGGPSGRNWGR